MKPPYAIGSVPSLSGHAIAYRWRSLPRVRRHRASKPQGSSERVLPWQITMDQLIFASLSHTHCWYEVGMLKVPAYEGSVYSAVMLPQVAADTQGRAQTTVTYSCSTNVYLTRISFVRYYSSNLRFLSCVCVCVVIPFILDVRLVDAPVGVTQDFFTFLLRCLP